MRLKTFCSLAAIFSLALATANSQTAPDPNMAHLEKRGAATQLIVDGKPYLVLGGETDNTASSSLEYMDTVWPKLAKMNLNTVLVGIGWDWVEPVEGKYDFTLVDGLLTGARKNNLHLMFLWFGSWKNGLSSFAPEWVKADQQRFPRARLKKRQGGGSALAFQRRQPASRHPRLHGLHATSPQSGFQTAHRGHDSIGE